MISGSSLTINLNTINMQAPTAAPGLTKKDSYGAADYEYLLNQSNYWKVKAEGFRNDV